MVSQLGKPLSQPKVINVVTRMALSQQQSREVIRLVEDEMDKYFSRSRAHPHLLQICDEILRRGNLTQFEMEPGQASSTNV